MRRARTHSILKLICSIIKLSEEGKKIFNRPFCFILCCTMLQLLSCSSYISPKVFPKEFSVCGHLHCFCFDHHSINGLITIFLSIYWWNFVDFLVILSLHTFVDDSFPPIGTRQLRFRSKELSHPDLHIQIYRHMANGNLSEVGVINFSV